MKKIILKTAVFCLLFAMLFSFAQNILHYRWGVDPDYYTRNLDFARQMPGSVDVVAFGTSELGEGYLPIVTYHTQGITGYNFGTSYKSSVTTYYQLLYALKHQTPKLVLCDFRCLFSEPIPSENDAIYHHVVETMSDPWLKARLVWDMCRWEPELSFTEWMFPLTVYHSMWERMSLQELREALKWDHVYDESYVKCTMGAQFGENKHYTQLRSEDVGPQMWEPNDATTELNEVAVKYYDMFIERCREKGIRVAALCMPSVLGGGRDAARWENMKAYLDSRGVEYLNYATYEQYCVLGLDLERDYLDDSHFTLNGAVTFSEAAARELAERFDLPDRRTDPEVSTVWDARWQEFEKLNP